MILSGFFTSGRLNISKNKYINSELILRSGKLLYAMAERIVR